MGGGGAEEGWRGEGGRGDGLEEGLGLDGVDLDGLGGEEGGYVWVIWAYK